MRRIATLVRSQPDPVQLHQANAAGNALLQVPPAFQTGPLKIDKRLRVAPLMRFGDQQPGRSAGGPGTQAAGLDEQDIAEASFGAGRCRADTQDPASDDQHVRGSARDASIRPAEHGPLLRGELIAPDGAVHGHGTHPG